MGALRTKADALYQQLSKPEQDMMRKLMLRMVSVEGDWASRRVPMEDLAYGPEAEAVVAGVIERLVEARLIVKGEGFIEPAHDALIRAWPMLREWVHAATPEMLILGGKLNASANEFLRSGDVDFLWNANPNLQAVKAELAQPGQWFNAKEADFIRKSVAQKGRKELIRKGIGATIVVALVAAIWFLQGRSNAREGLTAQVSLAMASEARALIAGTRQAGAEQTLQRLLAASALTTYSPEVDDALLASMVAFSNVTKLFGGGSAHYSSVAFGRDSSVIAGTSSSQSYGRWIYSWDAKGNRTNSWSAEVDVLSVAFDKTQLRIASGQADGKVVLRNIADEFDSVSLNGHASGVRSVAFSHDGSQLVSGASDGIRVWDLKARKLISTERVGRITSVAFSHGDDRIIAGGRDGLFLWERVGTTFGAAVKLHDGDVYSVAFHPAGVQVVVGGRDGLRLWNLKDRREIGPFQGQEGSVRSVAFSPDGLQIAAGADDGLTLWDAATRRRLVTAKVGSAAALAFSQDGSRLVIGGDGKACCLWDTKERRHHQPAADGACGRSSQRGVQPEGRSTRFGWRRRHDPALACRQRTADRGADPGARGPGHVGGFQRRREPSGVCGGRRHGAAMGRGGGHADRYALARAPGHGHGIGAAGQPHRVGRRGRDGASVGRIHWQTDR